MTFKSQLSQEVISYHKSALAVSYDCEDPRSF